MRHFGMYVLGALVLLTTSGRAAHALDINTCNTTCTVNCRLVDNVSCCANTNLPQCKGNGSITLGSGADLDMNGKTISCFCGTTTCNGGTNNNALCTVASQCPGGTCINQTGCTTCGYPAVTMTDSSSIVKNGVSTVARITGDFASGVDCQNKTSSRVTGIKIDSMSTGVTDCAQVDGNVFANGTGSIAIDNRNVGSAGNIHDNYIDRWGEDGIWANAGTVSHNLVYGGGVNNEMRFGMVFLNGDPTTDSNVFHGKFLHEDPDCGTLFCIEQGIILGNGGSAYTNNYCDETDPGCPFCREFGICATAHSPFVMP